MSSRPDWLFSTDNAEVAVQRHLTGAAPVYVRCRVFAYDLGAVTGSYAVNGVAAEALNSDICRAV